MTNEVSSETRRSTRITLAGAIANGLLQALSLVVLARLLAPRDYGVFATTMALLAMTMHVVCNALERALVVSRKRDGLSDLLAPSLAVIGGSAVAALAAFGSASFLGLDGLSAPVFFVLLGAYLVSGLAIIPRATLRRDFRFGRLVGAEFFGQLLGSTTVSIMLAAQGFGALSIALGMLASSVIVLVGVSYGHNLARRPSWSATKTLLKDFYAIVTIVSVEMALVQAPPVLLSSTLGAGTAGLFNRAAALINLPLQILTHSYTRVLLSSYTALADQREMLAHEFEKQFRLIAALCFPVAAGVAASAGAVVNLLMGEGWDAAKPLMAPIALFAAASMTAAVPATLAEGVRRFKAKTIASVAILLLTVAAMLIGSRWSTEAAVWALALSAVVRLIVMLALIAHPTGLSARKLVLAFAPSLATAAAIYSILSAMNFAHDGPGLAASITASALLLVCGLAVLDRNTLNVAIFREGRAVIKN